MLLSEALWNLGSSLSGGNPNTNWQVRQRLYINTKADGSQDFGEDPDLATETGLLTSVVGKQNRCEMWLSSRWDHSIFNAYLTPNSNSCNAANINNSPAGGRRGFFKATSQHTGGVNTAYGDGSVRFVNENVNIDVWRGMSTTEGGEATSY
jgi:prepilin-type processing-associated H-X9-DG protein